MTDLVRGRLPSAIEAPAVGERSHVLARPGGSGVVECILSGRLTSSVDYDQPYDEWVVVLDGGAVIEVGGESVALSKGDWILLPAHTPHRLVATEPATRWLALHASA
jgi:mannose-6-phosphate isomerase-like protein (cupin superfamily)